MISEWGTLDCVMLWKLDEQTFSSKFESHWEPNSHGLVTHLNKKSFVNYHTTRTWNTEIENVARAGGCIKTYIQGAQNKFPDFFRMDTFIDSTHMKL